MKSSADGPSPVDVHVGARLRARRKELSLSQAAAGQAVGCTFQQIQKYERGINRISASVLWGLAGLLEIEVGYFFEGLER